VSDYLTFASWIQRTGSARLERQQVHLSTGSCWPTFVAMFHSDSFASVVKPTEDVG